MTPEKLDHLPIIPHEVVASVDCCGCLTVRLSGDQATILCNECGAVIKTVPIDDLERTMLEMAQTDTICSALCTHCGAVNSFPRFSVIEAFTCSECGAGVVVRTPVQ